MSKADEVSGMIKKLQLPELLIMAATALDGKMSDSHIEFILIHVELALQKRKLMKQIGVEE